MTDNNNGGIRTTAVKITGSGKPYGVDIFITLETTHEFTNLATDEENLNRQQDLLTQLTANLNDLIKTASTQTKSNTTTVTPTVTNTAPQPTRYTPAPQPAAQSLIAAANGTQQGDWRSVPSRFGDGVIKFIASSVYSSDQLKADVASWINSQGLNSSLFDIWDERTGPRGAEAGVPIGSVFNIKIKKDHAHLLPEEYARNAAGRGKFNNDGSIYPYWTKDFEATIKTLKSVNALGALAYQEEAPF